MHATLRPVWKYIRKLDILLVDYRVWVIGPDWYCLTKPYTVWRKNYMKYLKKCIQKDKCMNTITTFYTGNYIQPYERVGLNAVYCKCCLCLQFCTSFSTLLSVLSFAVHGVSRNTTFLSIWSKSLKENGFYRKYRRQTTVVSLTMNRFFTSHCLAFWK